MSHTTTHSDVAIVGASLSGIVAAYLLGRAGLNVTIIDPQEFPRHKACGEGLSSLGLDYLKSYDLWSDELESLATPLFGYDITFEDGKRVALQARNSDSAPVYSISRAKLDSAIHHKVREMSAVTMIPEYVGGIRRIGDLWQLTTKSTGSEVSAHAVIVASGGRGVAHLFPEQLPTVAARTERYGMVYWSEGYWNSAPSPLVKIFQQPEGQYIITPLGDDSINVSMLLNKGDAYHPGKQELLRKAATFVETAGFNATTMSETLGAPAIHSSHVAAETAELYLIGDAVERFDAIGGLGMTHAVYSAGLAAQSIVTGSGPARYYRQRSAGARTLRTLTSLSYGLNVTGSRWQRTLVTRLPGVSYRVMEALKHTFPNAPQVPALRQAPPAADFLPVQFRTTHVEEHV